MSMPEANDLSFLPVHNAAPAQPNPFWVLFAVFKWVALGIGGLLAFLAFFLSTVEAAAVAGLACFFGILARIFQAEEHRRS
jgi:hypothetical protein